MHRHTCAHLWENTKDGCMRGTAIDQVNKTGLGPEGGREGVKSTWNVKERELCTRLAFLSSCCYRLGWESQANFPGLSGIQWYRNHLAAWNQATEFPIA